MNRKDFEIMAPVGSRESFAAALNAGADSIYFGIENLNMRAHSASTFTINDLKEIAQTCAERRDGRRYPGNGDYIGSGTDSRRNGADQKGALGSREPAAPCAGRYIPRRQVTGKKIQKQSGTDQEICVQHPADRHTVGKLYGDHDRSHGRIQR